MFIDLIKNKLRELDAEYDDEIKYFLDLVVLFINMDYKVKESIELAKESGKYYVNEHYLDSLLDLS